MLDLRSGRDSLEIITWVFLPSEAWAMVHTQDSFWAVYFISFLLCKEIISIDLPILSIDLSSCGKLQTCLFGVWLVLFVFCFFSSMVHSLLYFTEINIREIVFTVRVVKYWNRDPERLGNLSPWAYAKLFFLSKLI